MSFQISEFLVADDLTVLLGLIAATIFLLHNLYKPQALAHPILLGRQSDVSRVRNAGESAVYRNYGTGLLGRFPVRPAKDVHVLSDLVKPDFDAPRTLWSTKITNSQLRDRISAFGTGLVRLAGLHPNESSVLLFLDDGIEFLISDLALAAHAIPSLTLSSPSLLSPVLESHPPSAIIVNAKFLPQLLELIYDSRETGHHTVIVVGETQGKYPPNAADQVNILNWADVEREGAKSEKIAAQTIKSSDVFTVAYHKTESGQLHGAQFTHESITAGVTATRSLLPTASPISPLDTIISAHSMSTPFGRSIAYTALYEGTGFATLDSTKITNLSQATDTQLADMQSIRAYPIPPPTILFAKPGHVDALASALVNEAKKSSSLYMFAWRQKLAGITEGFITKDSLWDRLVFDNARSTIVGESAGTLRAVIVSGGPLNASVMTPARIAFSVPLINAYTHPACTAPVLASHPLDLQTFPVSPNAGDFDRVAHVGPPGVNVEAKLLGVRDDAVEGGGDPVGTLFIRGPPVGKVSGPDTPAGAADSEEGWISTEARAKVQTNGSFKVLS